MKGFVRLMAVVVTAAVFVVACSKDKDSGKITLDSPAVFFAQAGGSATVGFTAQNIKTLSATSKPTGWDEAVVDLAGAMISVKAPSSEDIESGDAVKTGSFSFTGYTPGGTLVSATLFAGIVTTKDISAEVANSYIVTEPETNYLIDATRKGDGSQLATSYVDVVWQTASGFVQYADFEDGKASFYIGADSDDATKIKQGNAVIGAYDADGELIWSWHIWATDYDPDAEGGTVDFNGYTLMNRNLGALANDNSTTDKILASYGLYYQWGRKDPFIGPNTYQGSEGSGASMYSGSGSRVYLKMSESSAETGTMEYAIRNPLVFITGVADTDNDWLWSGRSDQLWSADDNVADKSVNDPCPYGWRVAPSGAFDNLAIVGTPAVGDDGEIRLDADRRKRRIVFHRCRTPPLRQRQDPEYLQSAAQGAFRRHGGATLGRPLLDDRRVPHAGCGTPFLVRETRHLGRHRKFGALCPRQRPSGALCEAAGQVGTSDTTGRAGNMPARPALV